MLTVAILSKYEVTLFSEKATLQSNYSIPAQKACMLRVSERLMKIASRLMSVHFSSRNQMVATVGEGGIRGFQKYTKYGCGIWIKCTQ